MNNQTKFEMLKKLLGSNDEFSYPYNSFEVKNLALAKKLGTEFSYQSFWYDEYKEKRKEYWPLNLAKESTYTDGISASMKMEDNKMYFSIIIYDCDYLHGQRESKRCQYKFEIDKYINLFDEIFDRLLNDKVLRTIKLREKQAKDLIFENTLNEILETLKG